MPGNVCYGHVFGFSHHKQEGLTQIPGRPEIKAEMEQLASEERMERGWLKDSVVVSQP